MAKAMKTVHLEKQNVIITADAGAWECGLRDLPEEIITQLALHGLSQKLGDSYANKDTMPEDTVPGLIAQLKAGIWATKSSTGGILAEALARVTGKTQSECVEVINGMHEEKVKALRANPAIKAASTAITAERAAAKAKDAPALDLDNLFED